MTGHDPPEYPAPILARLARDAGAVTIAAVVMPFDFEGLRNGTAYAVN
jgi:cell division GTPase FtsZ